MCEHQSLRIKQVNSYTWDILANTPLRPKKKIGEIVYLYFRLSNKFMAKLEAHANMDIPSEISAILIGLALMVVGWFFSPLGLGFQLLFFIVGIIVLAYGLIKVLFG